MEKSYWITSALLVCILAFSCSPPPSVSPDSTLSGEVSFPGAFGDRPIEQARVWIEHNGQLYDETRTDADGRFTMTNLPVGEFDVVCEKSEQYAVYRASDLHKQLFDTSDPSQFPRGQAFLRIELQAKPTTIRGKVVDEESGLPVEGASISTYPATVLGKTDSEGLYTIGSDRFELIRISVAASHPNYESAQVFIEKSDLKMAGLNDVPLIEMRKMELEGGIEQDSVEYEMDDAGKVIPSSGSN
jgi:hypothetical protein